MYTFIEYSNTTRTDACIRSLSWMHLIPSATNSTDHEGTPALATPSTLNLQEGWLATGNSNHIVSVTYTSMKPAEQTNIPDRTNFNLRAHRTDVRLVSWNIPYQKLATVDSKGVIFVWVKNENRWSLELINDRSHPVTDMCWSPDGRMTVICYEDGFILAGSVTGQRYWSTVLNNLQTKVSAVAWLPDMSHVLLGTTSGQIIVMDHHGNTTEVVNIATGSIRQILYSCHKFYPDAPDTNATRFVNDDYVLACSLDHGDVLLLTHYQDPTPTTISTHLKGLHLDWSSPGEILAIGGHRRVNDLHWINEVLFYNRQGEFLHRTKIPQMDQPLTALCWAHGNDIVFVACGSFVYTVRVTHQALPSMLTICQMKVRRYLSKNPSAALDSETLPSNLRDNLFRLYPSIIKGFLPDPKTLRSFVCQPLKSHLRLQCTMKRIDPQDEPSSRNTSNASGGTYVLYLEYLGGLIPLLTAKRISKICPDFIIFDPQSKSTDVAALPCEKIDPSNSSTKKTFLLSKSRSNTSYEMNNVSQTKGSTTMNRSGLIGNRNSIYVAESETHRDRETMLHGPRRSSSTSDDQSTEDDDDQSLINLQEKSSKKKLQNKTMKQKYSNKLCTIAANIWGTRFKFYGHSNHLPEVLGCVIYKTSFLHLQPRQMTVIVANNEHQRRRCVPRPSSSRVLMETPKKQSKKTIETNRSSSSTVNLLTPIESPLNPSITPNPRPSLAATTTTMIRHLTERQMTAESSSPNSPSTSPMNLSRSTSPAPSITNFIRPISPPCIQMKEPLSPKFARASSTMTGSVNHLETSNATAANALNSEETSGNAVASSIPENCFEPETYRNLSQLNSNQQKKLSFSDPTLNQTTKFSRRSAAKSEETPTQTRVVPERHELDDHDDDDEIHSIDDIEVPSPPEEIPISNHPRSHKRRTNSRHRMMTCTGGASDSLPRLTSLSDSNETNENHNSAFYVMQNRPPLWNEQSQVYQLDFGGRVTLESAKNFQIEFKGKQVIQFGRIENNCYTLDFEWPFSPLQAFAVALANITQRLK